MKFRVMSIEIPEGLKCSVCGKIQRKEVYYPLEMTYEQATALEDKFEIDAFSDFVVGHSCLEGHCGYGFTRSTPDAWLDKILHRPIVTSLNRIKDRRKK